MAANNRAAGRARSPKDFIARVGVVIEEADESDLWLDVLETFKRGPIDRVISLRAEANALVAIFVASRQTAIKNRTARKRAALKKRRKA